MAPSEELEVKKEERGEEVGTKERKEFLYAHSLSFKAATCVALEGEAASSHGRKQRWVV